MHSEDGGVVPVFRRGAARLARWARTAVGRWDHADAVRTATRSVDVLRRVDRATRYRSSVLVGVHLSGIDELFERGAYDEALAAAEDVIEDCRSLRRAGSEAAARAHGERARCLARLDRLDESIDEFASSLEGRSARRRQGHGLAAVASLLARPHPARRRRARGVHRRAPGARPGDGRGARRAQHLAG